MASSDQLKNMTEYLRGAKTERTALIERLRELDQEIAHTEHTIHTSWVSHFKQPNEQVDSSDFEYEEYEEYFECFEYEECLRKRKTKNVCKGVHSRNLNCDYRSKKLANEFRASKRSKRSPTQSKGDLCHGILEWCADCLFIECACEDRYRMFLVKDETGVYSGDWVEKINNEILAMVSSW